jgi:hypothetical protein
VDQSIGAGGVSGVEFAVDDFFANGGPADFAAELDAESVLGEEAEVGGHGERRGVGEREKAETKRAGSGRGIGDRESGNREERRHRDYLQFSRRCATAGRWRNYCCSNNSSLE